MRYRVVFRPDARADLRSIYNFVADALGEAIAASMISRIERLCQSLSDFPNRGVRRDDLGPNIRTIPFAGRATVAYRVEDDVVRIGRIFYAGRDYGPYDLRN